MPGKTAVSHFSPGFFTIQAHALGAATRAREGVAKVVGPLVGGAEMRPARPIGGVGVLPQLPGRVSGRWNAFMRSSTM